VEVDNDVDDENLDADHDDDAPLRFRSMSNILATPGFMPRAMVAEELHVVSSDEPTSLAEAERSLSWRKTMMEEMDSIKENVTWSLVDLPPGRKSIGVKWVFKVKQDEHGVVSKHKARLVVKGYAQRHSLDYDEIFMPVARLDFGALGHRPHGARGVGDTPYGRQISIHERRPAGRGLRRAADEFHRRWQAAQSAQTKEGIVRVASSATSLEREAGRYTIITRLLEDSIGTRHLRPAERQRAVGGWGLRR
jgi:hypothetical protein